MNRFTGYNLTLIKIMIVGNQLHICCNQCSILYCDPPGRHHKTSRHHHDILTDFYHMGPDSGQRGVYNTVFPHCRKYLVHEFFIFLCSRQSIIEPEYELGMITRKSQLFFRLFIYINSDFCIHIFIV